MNIKPIRTQEDYEITLKRVDSLMDALPNPIEAIKFRMEQENLQQKDLIPIIGDKAVVSKVLSGQRKLTVEMIKKLNEQLKIPFESLFGKMAT